MKRRKRPWQLPSPLRRWIQLVRDALHQWSQSFLKALSHVFSPSRERERRIRPEIEILEAKTAASDLLAAALPVGGLASSASRLSRARHGSSDTATVTGSNGSFAVIDDYTYLKAGVYPVSVSITDSSGASTSVISTANPPSFCSTLSVPPPRCIRHRPCC